MAKNITFHIWTEFWDHKFAFQADDGVNFCNLQHKICKNAENFGENYKIVISSYVSLALSYKMYNFYK